MCAGRGARQECPRGAGATMQIPALCREGLDRIHFGRHAGEQWRPILLSPEYQVLSTSLALVQQHALVLFFADEAVEKLVVFEVDLDERRALRDRTLDQRF